MKYFSMFSGIGGFELGIQRVFDNEYAHSGQKSESKERPQRRFWPFDKQKVLLHPGNWPAPLCAGYSEIDKHAIKVYERHFEHTNYGDATTINATELPDFDLLVGGFPCQAFSIAGKRAGFNDTRGTLFFDIARILAEKRPRHLVLENVKGLLSHDSGETFQTILGVLSDLGYRVEWQVLNSKDFGVPQNRERIYFVGHLRGECTGEVLPISRINRVHLKEITSGVSDAQRIYTTAQAKTLKGLGGGLGAKTGLYAMRGRANGQQLEPSGDYTNTITSVTKDNLWLEDYRIRRLTPLECERLQGFPDNWTEGESDTQRYKMCGNAVTVNTVQAVMESLFQKCTT